MLEYRPKNLSDKSRKKLFFTYPYEVSGYHPRSFRVRAWMGSRGLTMKYPRIQLNTYYALTVLQFALDAILDNFSRDYLLEFIEHEAENELNPGTYPRLSLGPGQRFASKGAYIVKIRDEDIADVALARNIVEVSKWIIP
ncbi:hypothetical protein ACFL17_01865 [Pseudomonadota bacterium]